MTGGYTFQIHQGSASGLFSPTTLSLLPAPGRAGVLFKLAACCCSACCSATTPCPLLTEALQLPLPPVLQLGPAGKDAAAACSMRGKLTGQAAAAAAAASSSRSVLGSSTSGSTSAMQPLLLLSPKGQPAVDVACCRYVELLVSAMRFMLLLLSLGGGGGGPSSCSSSSSLLSSGCTWKQRALRSLKPASSCCTERSTSASSCCSLSSSSCSQVLPADRSGGAVSHHGAAMHASAVATPGAVGALVLLGFSWLLNGSIFFVLAAPGCCLIVELVMSPKALRLTTVPAGCCCAASLRMFVMFPKALRADFKAEPCLSGACKEVLFSLNAACSNGPVVLFSSLKAGATCKPCILAVRDDGKVTL